MKFKLKIQQYQTNAVENTTVVFAGQPNKETILVKVEAMFAQNIEQSELITFHWNIV